MLKTNMLKPNIQLFAEGDPGTTPADPTPTPANPTPQGRVFSEEYVGTLRKELAGYRTQAKTYEAALRKALGVADGEELGNIDERIANVATAHQTAIDNALSTANDHLITAGIFALEDYDHKLLDKVMTVQKYQLKKMGR